MHRRINWRKGMRLTDDLFRKADECTAEHVSRALALAAAGRFGLLPSTTPFQLTLSITDGFVEVTTLDCLTITKSGEVVDVYYDTRYTNTFDTRVKIPDGGGRSEYFLVIEITDEPWRDNNDGYETPCHTFSLLPPDTPVPSRAVPIARIVNSGGWKMDEEYFVPPVIYIAAHPKMMEQHRRFVEKMRTIDDKCRKATQTAAVRFFWPEARRLAIQAEKEWDTMTPMRLLSLVQQCVGLFACACSIDEDIELEDEEDYNEFAMAAYNYKDVYAMIVKGVGYSIDIDKKIDKLKGGRTEKKEKTTTLEAPTISDKFLSNELRTGNYKFPVVNNTPGATVYYTIDGSEPTIRSKSGTTIKLVSGFANSRAKEPDKSFTVKLMAELNGKTSKVNTYTVKLIKDYKHYNVI